MFGGAEVLKSDGRPPPAPAEVRGGLEFGGEMARPLETDGESSSEHDHVSPDTFCAQMG